MPTNGQILIVMLAVLLFAAGGVVSILRLRNPRDSMRIGSKACLYFGILCCVGVLTWHDLTRGNWMPIGDNFDALLWLGGLLALFVAYVQRSKRLAGLDWLLMPVVILMLVMAVFFGRKEYHAYVGGTWSWVHRVTAYGGAVAFALAAATGVLYLLVSRRLRSKSMGGTNFGSLERLEHSTRISVTLGFALLTVGLITGVVRMLHENKHVPLQKLALACSAWVVYALVLHAPINPSFRGRKTAMLSIVGFVLMIGTILAVQTWPGGSR